MAPIKLVSMPASHKRRLFAFSDSRMCSIDQLKSDASRFAEALEGCGDSTDLGFSMSPQFEIIPSSHLMDDVCEGTGSPPTSSLVVRLSLSQTASGNLISRSISGASNPFTTTGSKATAYFGDYFEEELDGNFSSDQDCSYSDIQADRSVSLQNSMSMDSDVDRVLLVERLSEAAGHLQLNAQALYLAVCLMDLCLTNVSRKGRKIDAVQREILALTCLYISCIQLSSLDLSPDQFVWRAKIAKGTVKGCMISCQLSVVESLVGVPLEKQLSFCRLWALLDSVLSNRKVEHMAEFVCLLAGSAYGNLFFPEYLLQAASSVQGGAQQLSSGCVQVLLNALYPPLEAEIDMDMDDLDGSDDLMVEDGFPAVCGTQQRNLYTVDQIESLTCR